MEYQNAYAGPTGNLRTGGELAIKTITVHIFAISNYVFMSSLQRRPIRSKFHMVNIILFTFVPTIVLVEFVNSVFRSLYQFIRSQIKEADENKHAWFHFSASVGVCGSVPVTDPVSKEDKIHQIPLLNLDPALCYPKRIDWSWSWAGKLFGTVFALTQAIGTIFMWARRIQHADCLSLDHRNGAMAIASTICSFFSIIVLFLRFTWSSERVLHSAQTEKMHPSWSATGFRLFCAMTLQVIIGCMVNTDNRWLYTSSSVFIYVTGLMGFHDYAGESALNNWQTLLLAIVLFIFRRDIGARIGADSTRVQAWIRHPGWRRIKALTAICFGLWMLGDILKWFAENIGEVIACRDDPSYWWQDPISDKIFVI